MKHNDVATHLRIIYPTRALNKIFFEIIYILNKPFDESHQCSLTLKEHEFHICHIKMFSFWQKSATNLLE